MILVLFRAILTIFQIPDAAGDPVTRTTAILSLICSLMSLTYGCMYIVRFGTMRTMLRASKWAEVWYYSTVYSLNDIVLSFRKHDELKPQSYGMYGFCLQCQLFGSLGKYNSTRTEDALQTIISGP